MTSRRIGVSTTLVLALTGLLAACASSSGPDPLATGGGAGSDPDFATPKPVALRAEAVKASAHFADSAVVEDGKVTVPADAENQKILDRLAPGAILAGNRDSRSADLATSKNPYGFLRKVLSVSRAGDKAVVLTEQAYLNQLIDEGDLVWDGSPRASIFEDGELVTKQNVGLRGPSGASSGSGQTTANATLEDASAQNVKFRPVVKISNTRIGVDTTFAGELKFRKALGIPYGVQRANARLDLDPVIAADLEYGARVMSAQSQAGGSLYKSYESPSVPIPIGGPIPLTVRLRAEINCSLTIQGEVTATSRLSLRGHTAAGFRYEGGTDLQTIYEEPRLQATHDFLGVSGKAGIIGECAVQAVVSLLAFDAVGLEGKVGPFGAITGEVCATYSDQGVSGGFALYEQHGLRVNATGRLQVPGLAYPSVNKDLFGFKPLKSDPRYFVGSAETCKLKSKDSCTDKPDGLYCSELAAGSSYLCRTGQIAGGQQCPGTQRCTGPNGPGTTIQCR